MKDLADPGKFLVLLDKTAGHTEYDIVNGETVFHTGDHLVLIAQAEYSSKVLEFFGNVSE